MAEHTRRIPIARSEPKDIGPGFIWGAVATCAGVLAACALLVPWLYPRSMPERGPLSPLPIYPAPRLQTDPAADMRGFRAREMAWLNTTGWVDKSQGVVHIPISEAMQQIAQEGIPAWPKASSGAPSASNDPSTPP